MLNRTVRFAMRFSQVMVASALLIALAPISATATSKEARNVLVGRAVAVCECIFDWNTAKARIASSDIVRLSFFTQGERGDEEQLMFDLRRDRAQIGAISLSSLARIVPELEVMLLPKVFGTRAEAAFVFNNYLLDLMSELLAQKGLRLVHWATAAASQTDEPIYGWLAIVANRDWFEFATMGQQRILGNAWRHDGSQAKADTALTGTLTKVPSRSRKNGVKSSAGVADLDRWVARIGGQSAAFVAAVRRGKQAFAGRSAKLADP